MSGRTGKLRRTEPVSAGRRIERWYDRGTRAWVCQLLDAEGNQLGSAIYEPDRASAAGVTEENFWDAPAPEEEA